MSAPAGLGRAGYGLRREYGPRATGAAANTARGPMQGRPGRRQRGAHDPRERGGPGMRTAPGARGVGAGLARRRPAIGIGPVLAGSAPASVLAPPLLASAASSFGPGVLGVPAWVDVDVAVVMFGLTALAALAPARRLTRFP